MNWSYNKITKYKVHVSKPILDQNVVSWQEKKMYWLLGKTCRFSAYCAFFSNKIWRTDDSTCLQEQILYRVFLQPFQWNIGVFIKCRHICVQKRTGTFWIPLESVQPLNWIETWIKWTLVLCYLNLKMIFLYCWRQQKM